MTSGSSKQVLNAILLKISQLLGVVAHSENPSTWEAEAGELLAYKLEASWGYIAKSCKKADKTNPKQTE